MKTKKAKKRPRILGRKPASQAKRKKRRGLSFQARSRKIHDSLDDAIHRIESEEMNPESAKEILEKIAIIQTLLRAAKQELQRWLDR